MGSALLYIFSILSPVRAADLHMNRMVEENKDFEKKYKSSKI